MSRFDIKRLDAGRFAVCGDMSFDTAEHILQASEKAFADQQRIEIDLSAVEKTDSAGLALLLEWMSRAKRDEQSIEFTNLPEKLLAIAETTEVNTLLAEAYSSSSKK